MSIFPRITYALRSYQEEREEYQNAKTVPGETGTVQVD